MKNSPGKKGSGIRRVASGVSALEAEVGERSDMQVAIQCFASLLSQPFEVA
jgi:hypothetical protein